MTRAADRPEQTSDRSAPPTSRRSRFSALRSRNFRLFLLGQAVATTGLWVQRIAQDWLVLSLTGDATAVGVTTALQWAPTLVFGLAAGWIADRYPKRRVLQATQVAAAAMAALLAALTLTHQVTAWHVQLVAAGLGTVAAIDWPVRLAFVTELVERDQMHSAISLNASTFQLGGFVGPAVSGVLVGAVGPGWAFAVNAACYVAPFLALARIDPDQIPHPVRRAAEFAPGGLRRLARRPEIWRPITVAGVFSMFALNLPVTLAAYAGTARTGPLGYALLTATAAVGSIIGGLIAAGRTRTTLRGLTRTGYALAGAYLLAAAMPTPWSLMCALTAVGIATQQMYTAANATLQLTAGQTLRGRVMGAYLLVIMGCGAVGGPLLGMIAQHLGPRAGLAVAGVVPAAVLLLLSLARLARRAIGPGLGEP
ncbi:MFS transporter [Pseudonocardia acaciae]|uniref:MFS transporter n=1 Tax=Pseudonocardia acaciae TaxID=551276 RepID=UPI00068719F3|nr:MFS transporter [Pseudonocardia acaciae]